MSGHKIWMSLGMHADWLYVLCRTDRDAPAHAGISLLIVPRREPGVDIRPIRNLAGDAEFCEVFLDGARTDADLVVGGVNNGWQVAMGTLGTERVLTTLPAQLGFPLEFQALREAVVRAGLAPIRSRAISSSRRGSGSGSRSCSSNGTLPRSGPGVIRVSTRRSPS